MRRLLLLAPALLAGCTKSAPAGRPADVCAEVKAQVSCDKVADASLQGALADAGNSPAQNCFWVGNQQFHCGLFDAASRSFQRSAELAPDARTFHALGEAEYLQEHWQAASDAFRHAVDQDGKKRESWVRLGQVRLRLGQPADAIDAAQRAAALDPQKPDALRVQADALAAQGGYAKAVDVLHRAEKLGDRASQAGATAREVELLSLQLRKLQKAHADEMVQADVQGQLADALDRELGFGDAAVSATNQVGIYRSLADARLASGDFTAAEAALRKVSELDPKDFVSQRLVGAILEKKGDPVGARKALQASLKVEPKQSMPFIVLGRLDAAAGDAAAARKDFDQALANADGKDAFETRQLAELASKVGALDKAEALYKSLETEPDLKDRVDFWLDRAAASEALHHAAEVKAACARAHALVETSTCPPVSPRR